MNNPYRFFVALILFGLSLPAAAAVNAWLDRTEVAPGQSVQLTLEHDGQTDSQPDLSPLKQNFEILGSSSSSSVNIVNGKMSSKVQLILALSPKHEGKLLLPPLQWDGHSTPPLTLTVGNGGGASGGKKAAGGNALEFMTVAVDQKQPYVQAAVTLTVRLYLGEPMYQASLDLQPNNDVLIQQLGKDSQGSETRNGRSYQVVERKYLLFPQRSGHIRLDGPVLNAQVADTSQNIDPFGNNPFFGNTFGRSPFAGMLNAARPIRLQGDAVALDVRPRPASETGHNWLPARNVTLEESWQPKDGPFHAGDPVTRHLHLRALGLGAAQLPDLSQLMSLPAGLRAYPDQPALNDSAEGDTVAGTRDQDIALIAAAPGRYEIPALHLYWWDTARNERREIELPARTLEVLPSTAGAISVTTAPPGPQTPTASPPPPGPSASVGANTVSGANSGNTATSRRWQWASFALALLWLGTVAAWWYSRGRSPRRAAPAATQPTTEPPRMTEARNAFRQACRANDAPSARRHLLDWARAVWPQEPPAGPRALAQRLGDPALEPLLNQLDRACYAGGTWQGKALLEALPALSARRGADAPGASVLPGLYPLPTNDMIAPC